MSFQTEYVLGFAFDAEGGVALIKKKRPGWQANRWNGIGGHRELNELPQQAMEREFFEETGVRILAKEWREAGIMRCDEVWRCYVLTTQVEGQLPVQTKTDEQVSMFGDCHIDNMGIGGGGLIENVFSLIQLCRMKPDHTGKIPFFHLDYTSGSKL